MSEVIEGSLVHVPAGNAALAVPVLESSWGGADTGQVAIVEPTLYLKMKQAMTQNADHITNGHFFAAKSGYDFGNEMTFVPLFMSPGREWKKSGNKYVPGEKPLCISTNGLVPITNNPKLEAQAPVCGKIQGNGFRAACEKAKWGFKNPTTGEWMKFDKETKQGIPSCNPTFRIKLVEVTSGKFFVWNLKKKDNVDPCVAVLNSLLDQREQKIRKGLSAPELYNFKITVQTEKDGAVFIPKFVGGSFLNEEESAEYRAAFIKYVVNAKYVPETEEDDETADEESQILNEIADAEAA